PLHETFNFAQSVPQLLWCCRLVFESHGAHLETALFFFCDGNDVNRNVPGRLRVLQTIENTPSIHTRKLDIESYRPWCVLPGQSQAGITGGRGDDLEAAFASHFHHDLGEVQVVLDDQERLIAGFDTRPVVIDNVFHDEWFGFDIPCDRFDVRTCMRPPLL